MKLKIEQVNVNDLKLDRSYQRSLHETYKRIAKEFDTLLLGVITVSKRKNGMFIVDGQHRVAALKELGQNKIMALVYEGLSYKDEIKIFALQNDNRITITSWEAFNAGKIIEGSIYNLLDKELKAAGLEPTPYVYNAKPKCIGEMSRIIRNNGVEMLRKVFWCYKNSKYKDEPKFYNNRILRILVDMLKQFTPTQVVTVIDNEDSLDEIIGSVAKIGSIKTAKIIKDKIR